MDERLRSSSENRSLPSVLNPGACFSGSCLGLEYPGGPEIEMSKTNRGSIWFAALCGLLLLTGAISPAKADRRVALVVGNSHYTNPNLFLSNPRNDAEDNAAALRGVGFEVLLAVNA